MTTAQETYIKRAGEKKAIVVDVHGVIGSGETVSSVDAVTKLSGTGTLTLSGEAVNTVLIEFPGRRDIPIGEGIEFFVEGGTAGQLYQILVEFTTSEGQELEAVLKLKVK